MMLQTGTYNFRGPSCFQNNQNKVTALKEFWKIRLGAGTIEDL
jgi:hypothetical protein